MDVEGHRAAAGSDLENPRLDPALDAHAAEDQAADDRNGEAGAHVKERDLRTEEAPQEHDGNLIDHRAADQEGKRDAKRDAGLNEANEKRYGGATAERCHDAKPGGRDRAGQDAASGE